MTIDWTVKENVKAKMRVMVKRILIKYNYPPDKQPQAVKTILEQAEILCGEIAGYIFFRNRKSAKNFSDFFVVQCPANK